MRFRFALLLTTSALAATLAGCAGGPLGGGATGTAEGGVPSGAMIMSGTCNVQAGQYAIGQRATPALQSELITKTLAKTLRVIRPGEAVTQEFSSQRLNLQTDASGRITSISCG
ncbi:proteinase inhibitor I78 [Xylophilus rhododendri]|uniref:Proteinase inhibitor I78 n=1 Tax=Xylophilus rhododendri TaxID=2697032 RepID=A0A857J5S0_9BURK|nr:I78 family peptidase inhibitor [Xylophilus rhododendri]QHI98439.1 proteinase inhibitor I78 [Xylophilus rhododendri]